VALRRSRKPAWLRHARRLADSNRCKRLYAAKQENPAKQGFSCDSEWFRRLTGQHDFTKPNRTEIAVGDSAVTGSAFMHGQVTPCGISETHEAPLLSLGMTSCGLIGPGGVHLARWGWARQDSPSGTVWPGSVGPVSVPAWPGPTRPGWARWGKAWLPYQGRSRYRHGPAQPGEAGRDEARRGLARQGTGPVRLGEAPLSLGRAWFGRARSGLAGRDETRSGEVWRGSPSRGEATQGLAWYDGARQVPAVRGRAGSGRARVRRGSARLGMPRLGETGSGEAWHNAEWCGAIRLGEARFPSVVRSGEVGPGSSRCGVARFGGTSPGAARFRVAGHGAAPLSKVWARRSWRPAHCTTPNDKSMKGTVS
jgi:hypothetical protein